MWLVVRGSLDLLRLLSFYSSLGSQVARAFPEPACARLAGVWKTGAATSCPPTSGGRLRTHFAAIAGLRPLVGPRARRSVRIPARYASGSSPRRCALGAVVQIS